MLKSLSTPTKDGQNTHATLSCKCCLRSFPSQPIFWSTARTLPLLPHLSLMHHQRQHHFWPQVHPHFTKQYWHRSPKTSNLSEPVDMSRSSFGTSLPRTTLLASIPCFSGLFPPVHGPGLFSLTHLCGLLSACPSAHSFSTIPGCAQQSHQPYSFHTACTWTTNESTSFTLISPSICRPEYLTAR